MSVAGIGLAGIEQAFGHDRLVCCRKLWACRLMAVCVLSWIRCRQNHMARTTRRRRRRRAAWTGGYVFKGCFLLNYYQPVVRLTWQPSPAWRLSPCHFSEGCYLSIRDVQGPRRTCRSKIAPLYFHEFVCARRRRCSEHLLSSFDFADKSDHLLMHRLCHTVRNACTSN